MSWLEKAEQQLGTQAIALRAISALTPIVKETLVKRGIGTDELFGLLQLIERVFDRIADGFDGKVTMAEAEKHIKELVDRLAEQDAAIDDKIANKFGGTP